MFDEHTVPNDNFDGWRSASGGGIPGGVDERCRPGTFMAKTKSTCMSCVRRARGMQSINNYLEKMTLEITFRYLVK